VRRFAYLSSSGLPGLLVPSLACMAFMHGSGTSGEKPMNTPRTHFHCSCAEQALFATAYTPTCSGEYRKRKRFYRTVEK